MSIQSDKQRGQNKFGANCLSIIFELSKMNYLMRITNVHILLMHPCPTLSKSTLFPMSFLKLQLGECYKHGPNLKNCVVNELTTAFLIVFVVPCRCTFTVLFTSITHSVHKIAKWKRMLDCFMDTSITGLKPKEQLLFYIFQVSFSSRKTSICYRFQLFKTLMNIRAHYHIAYLSCNRYWISKSLITSGLRSFA